MQRRNAVLVVSDDLGLRDEVGAWVEAAGREVLTCPGPGRGGCVGLSRKSCALEHGADVVVLDLHPSEHSFVDNTRRAELVDHYSASGKPVLVLIDEESQAPQIGTSGAATLSRLPERNQVLEAIQELLDPSRPKRQRRLGRTRGDN